MGMNRLCLRAGIARLGRPSARPAIAAAATVATAIGVSLAGPGVALASTLTVTNCSGSSTVAGSLPDEVASAAAGDTIVFDTSCHLILLLGTISIGQNLTITGPGAATMAVSGDGAPVISVTAGTVSISGLTIENGSGPSAMDNSGGGISNDGGT
jgi:hypothetical protein